MNTIDWHNAMIENQKRAERMGRAYDYELNDGGNWNDDDWNDDDWNDDDWDDDDWDDDDRSHNTVTYKYTITNKTSVSELANQIATNMAKSQNKSYDAVYQEAFQLAEKWIKEHYEHKSDRTTISYRTNATMNASPTIYANMLRTPLAGIGMANYAYNQRIAEQSRIAAERSAAEQRWNAAEHRGKEYSQKVHQPVHAGLPSVSVNEALAALKQFLTDNTLTADAMITSENNTIMIIDGQCRLCLITDAITKQTLSKIADKMNRRFHCDDRTDIELLLIDLKTALEMADWNRYTLHVQKQ